MFISYSDIEQQTTLVYPLTSVDNQVVVLGTTIVNLGKAIGVATKLVWPTHLCSVLITALPPAMEEGAGEYLAEVEVEVEEVPSHSFSSSPLDLPSSFSPTAAFWFTAAA
jgi:hypothetical protein